MKLSLLDGIIIFGACLFIEWTEGKKPCYYKTIVNKEGKSEWIKEGDNCDIITFGGVKLEEDESTTLKISSGPGSSNGGDNSAVDPTSMTATTKEKEPEVSTTKDVSSGPGSSNGGDNSAVDPTSIIATTKEKEPEVSTTKDVSSGPGSSNGGVNSPVDPTSITATTKEKELEISTTKDVSSGPGSSKMGDNSPVDPTSMTATTKEKEPEVPSTKDERPTGFGESFVGSYYKVVHIHTLNRTTAQQTCERSSSHLVFIESEEENNFINSLIHSDQHQYWIGLKGLEQNLHWDDGTREVFYNFGEYSFNDKNGCYRISKQSDGIKWRDHPCSMLYGYICEYEY
ncbi:uncharacterized protein [Apostichopus japonicus]|uniref:uncharacterized protein n=1 Tax=Stichopus japonicus TaxID=307972 RepID=UPI003AB728DB